LKSITPRLLYASLVANERRIVAALDEIEIWGVVTYALHKLR